MTSALLTLLLCVGMVWPAQARVVIIEGVDGKFPTAIVERVTGAAVELKKYQILWTEEAFDLKEGEEVVLSYFVSCLTETIVGGHVEVGQEESSVSGGNVSTEYVYCDGGQPGWMACAFEHGSLQEPYILMFSTYPLLLFYGQDEGVVTVERIDSGQLAQRHAFEGGVLDFAEMGIAFDKGAEYRFSLEGQDIVAKARIWSKASGKPGTANGRFLAIPTDAEFGRECR